MPLGPERLQQCPWRLCGHSPLSTISIGPAQVPGRRSVVGLGSASKPFPATSIPTCDHRREFDRRLGVSALSARRLTRSEAPAHIGSWNESPTITRAPQRLMVKHLELAGLRAVGRW